jgi:hypothetical protein
MAALRVYQSLWATEQRRPGMPERPFPERFDAVKAAGYDGMAIDLGALDLAAARACAPEYARTGLSALLTAFPTSIDALRPALQLAKDIGAPFVIVVGQVMPITVPDMIPVVRAWLRIAAEESVPIQFETHRNCITNDLFATLLLLDAVPELRLCADLSHFLLDREFWYPISKENHALIRRILERSDSFQGRVASREQIQVQVTFPQHQKWFDLFAAWWEEGMGLWLMRAEPDATLRFLCELGPPEYAITGADGYELSDRWEEALIIRKRVEGIWARLTSAAPAGA